MIDRRVFRLRRAAALIALAAMALGVPIGVQATDVVNGWSATATIGNVYSLSSATMFKLNGVSQGCGHPDYWVLALNDTTASKNKHAVLLAAFTAGKTVSLRCENSTVTDFQVFE